MLCYPVLYYAVFCSIVLICVVLCYVMLCYVMLCCYCSTTFPHRAVPVSLNNLLAWLQFRMGSVHNAVTPGQRVIKITGFRFQNSVFLLTRSLTAVGRIQKVSSKPLDMMTSHGI